MTSIGVFRPPSLVRHIRARSGNFVIARGRASLPVAIGVLNGTRSIESFKADGGPADERADHGHARRTP